MTRVTLLIVCLFIAACGSKGSPTAPPPANTQTPAPNTPAPTPTPTPAPITTGYLSGRVTQAGPGSPVENARIEILNAPNAGKSTLTNASGQYTLPDLTLGNATIRVSKAGFNSRDLGIVLAGVATMQNVAIQTTAPWSISGTGNNVFDVPTWLSRVRVVGTYSGRCQNFAMYIGRDLVVNEILGTCSIAIGPRYEGVHLITGGVSRTEISTGVSWSVTEVR